MFPRFSPWSRALRLAMAGFSGIWSLIAAEPVISRIRDARQLSNAEVTKSPKPAVIEGTMLLSDSEWSNWFLHDGDSGIYVYAANVPLKAKSGDRVRLSGWIAEGGFAPLLELTNEVVLGPGTYPPARTIPIDQLLTGSEDSQWIEVTGILIDSVDSANHTVLTLGWSTGELSVSVSYPPGAPHLTLRLGSELRVRGVAASNYNGRKRLLGVRIHTVATRSIDVISEGPPDPFALPLTPLSDVFSFSPKERSRTQIHTRGIVSAKLPNGTAFIQLGVFGLRTMFLGTNSIQVGDSVEAVGFPMVGSGLQNSLMPELILGVPALRSTRFRQTTNMGVTQVVNAESVGTLRDGDASLVEVVGRVEGTLRRGSVDLATVVSTKPARRVFTISLDRGNDPPSRLATLRKGAKIHATGVLDVSMSPDMDPDQAVLHLRSIDDLSVRSEGPWFTERRAGVLGAALVAIIAGAATWNIQLRRKVERQTQAIQRKLEQERALEKRYNDLAENAVDLILTLRLDGTVITVNAAVFPLLGYQRNEVIGANVLEHIAARHREWIAGRFREIAATGKVDLKVATMDVVSASGKIVSLEASSHLVQGSDSAPILKIVARDVTERNRAQEQRDGQGRILGMIASGAQLEDVLEELMRFIEAASPGVLGSILRLDADGVTLRKAAAPSLPEAYNAAIEGIRAAEGVGCCGTAVARGTPVLVADISTDPLWAGPYAALAATHGLRSCWSFPIHSTAGRILGTFALYRREVALPTPEELAVVDIGKSLASVALERAESENAIRTSEERLRACIADAPHVGVQWYDELGRVIFWNHASERMFGWTSTDAMGRTLDQLIFTPEQGAAFLEVLRDLKLNGGQFGPQEFPFRTREGNPGVCLSTVFRLPAKTGADLYVCMDVDVTARVSAETALIASEQRQRMVIASLAEGVILIERDGAVSAFNEQVGILLGNVGTDYFRTLAGPMPWEVLREDGTKLAEEEYPPAVTFRTGEPQQDVVLGIRHHDGRIQWLSVNSRPAVVEPSGQVGSVVVSFADVTTRKQVQEELIRAKEEAESANRAKTDFLAIMSHEIRTPLNGVIGFTDLLLNSHLAEEHRQFAETIKQSGEILLALINDILDLSKIEAGRLELQNHPFGFIDLAVDVVGIMAVRAEEKGIELAICVAGDLPQQMVGDGGRVRQVLMNLVGNAVKFTDRGHVLVEVERDAEGLVVSVTDTGPGIPSDKRDQLFRRFSQIESPATRQHGGTGLGLAISKELVRMMGGEIGQSDGPGGGSRFWFRLPCPPPSESKSFRPPAALLGIRVLIANASPVNQRVLRRQLSAWGCATDLVDSEHVLEWLATGAQTGRPWDVVLLDLSTPANSMLVRLAREIREGNWPAVGLVAIHRRSTAASFFANACEATLSKPLAAPEPLQSAIHLALKRSKFRDVAT